METFDAGQSPFREGIETIRFFPGGQRRETLEAVKTAIVESVSLIILTGEEGCGKTMMCRMVERDLPEGYVIVFFQEMLASFEDVTRTVAREMEITLADGIPAGDIRELLLEVCARLSEKKMKMLLVFDQAERIYLATLERIRKMLDIVNQDGINLQILFSGGEGLLDNLKQLSICSFKGAEERHFALAPLDSSATYAYLNFCMQSQGEDEIFSLETSERIFSLAKGNFKKTNKLADELVRSMTPDSSFMVLLDNVRDTFGDESPKKWDLSFFREKYLTHKKWLIPSGVCLVILLLILTFQTGKSPVIKKKESPPKVTRLSAELKNIEKKENSIEDKGKTATTPKPQHSEKVGEAPRPAKTPVASSSGKVESITIKKIAQVASEPPAPKVRTSAPVEIKPDKSAKKIPLVSVKTPKETAEKIFKERTQAATKWLVGEKNAEFTIQLMVLASEGAEKNLERMLVRKEYRDLADKLFILRKGTTSPSILVFYGEYATMTEARNALDALPKFLLKHKPYAISIKGAVKKVIGG